MPNRHIHAHHSTWASKASEGIYVECGEIEWKHHFEVEGSVAALARPRSTRRTLTMRHAGTGE